ncbi:MAG: acyl-CoA dehydrogenase family protein [Candidatus Electryonea clarkiae]|nr:acyl-CoA dehydrogenase family protein [Candidatus Electryonea clarkiae]MDP8287601.1 acyl-CoA dehydrogenase family protein [Candidatus Electryonea clarkiae]
MDFTFNEEQEMLRDMARKFTQKELKPIAAQIDETGEVPRKIIDQMAELGFMGLAFPEEYGGAGFGEVGYCIVLEELSRGCASTAAILGGHVSIGAMAIYLAGTEEQKQKFLPDLTSGEKIASFALTEPGAGSDAAAMRATAKEEDDCFVLNGQKTFITNGGLADVYSVFARTDPGTGTRGISTFIVEKDMPGFTAGPPEKKMGIHGSPTTDIFLEDVRVPKDHMLGARGNGFRVAMETLDVGRLSLGAQCLGLAKEALDLSILHANAREQFGGPIARLQAIQFMLADMAADVYAMENMTYKTAWMCDQKIRFSRESAIVKLFCSEALGRVVDKAVQVHGGMGYMSEYPIERFYRDARITRIFEGTNEIQRVVIARHLLKNKRF